MTEQCSMIDLFNSLAAEYLSGDINEAEFRRCAQKTFGYSDQEMRLIMKRIRRERPAGLGATC